jgi:tripartite-type tricarboxylate transporter receptor subunit TctC
VICCYGKGGGSDQSVDAIVGPAEKIMNAKFNKINKPGGGGLNCLPDFLQTPADGYTILQHIDTLPSRYVEGRIDLNPVEALEPLLVMNVAPTMLFINPDDQRFLTNGKPDWNKVVAYAKSKPGEMTVSNVNIPMEIVSMAMVERHFGIKTKQVMFDKPAERYGAVIGGQLDVLMEQPGDVVKHVEAGKLAPVLAIWPDRIPLYPDTVATGKDYGLNWEPLVRFRGLFVKKGTPKEVVSYLAAVFAESYKSPQHQDFLKRKSLDIVPSFRSADDTKKMMENALSNYAAAFKDLGMPMRPGL